MEIQKRKQSFACIFIFLLVVKIISVDFRYLLSFLAHLLGPGGCCKPIADQHTAKYDRLV